MDLRKAKILLEKINALHQSMSVDEEHIAEIEKDLMRNYIRQLYECYLASSEPYEVKKTPAPEIRATIQKEQPQTTSTPPAQNNPALISKKTVAEPSVPVAPPAEPVQSIATPPKTAASNNPVPPLQKTDLPASVTSVNNGDFEILFEFKEAKELSERLSQMPIKDLTRAMGLNERILTINELFGGNKQVFEETMHKLNGMNNFEEAKIYLAGNIAGQYNWISKEKKQKAKSLIKLIMRRYK